MVKILLWCVMKKAMESIVKQSADTGKSCIEKLMECAGITKLLESKPGYRKYLTKDGETLIIRS